jgi:hypothetical protein
LGAQRKRRKHWRRPSRAHRRHSTCMSVRELRGFGQKTTPIWSRVCASPAGRVEAALKFVAAARSGPPVIYRRISDMGHSLRAYESTPYRHTVRTTVLPASHENQSLSRQGSELRANRTVAAGPERASRTDLAFRIVDPLLVRAPRHLMGQGNHQFICPCPNAN